ncbi:hypothetical protein M513_11591 [Trichuris suis]|uniref:Reverse transcriptase domain-containing protein n=1 Tax=Trichuris suis TaxID=68888 RepID=A0A085LRF1_9BILA|nr:hypothetical protein M513_11591 [Trichuris suis]
MGSPPSPTLAEISMEHLEDKAFTNTEASIAPWFFKRYVDDIFAIVEASKEEQLLEYLNDLFPQVYLESSSPLCSMITNDKIMAQYDKRPGVVYENKCSCNASYIVETGNSLVHMYNQHLYGINHYNNALRKLNGTQESTEVPQTQGGSVPADIPQRKVRSRQPKKKPKQTERQKKVRNYKETMADATKGSAVVEHSSRCSLDLRLKIV